MSDANVIGNSSVRFLWMPHGTWEPTGVPKCSAGMAKIESVLAEVGELLAALTVEIQSASFEEMPALIDGARKAVRLVITRCLTFDPVAELPPEAAAMLRTELVRLGEALQAQIAGIVESKYPPAKPGALLSEPLEAAGKGRWRDPCNSGEFTEQFQRPRLLPRLNLSICSTCG